MKIIDPQTATLTNIEVLAFLTANPPRRPPNPPSNARHWIPKPDLRDHNTVVKEIHNYVQRISPHLLNYPRYVHEETLQQQQQLQRQQDVSQIPPLPAETEPTPLDIALRSLITKLQPYGLTKAEVLMIINLGVGLDRTNLNNIDDIHGQDQGQSQEAVMENGENSGVAAQTIESEGGQPDGDGEVAQIEDAEQQEGGEEEDYGALALLDTVIEEREERLSNEDVSAILAIIRETLGRRNG